MTNTRKALEDEIQEHLTAIIVLKTRLNALTAIASLPSELLSEIFIHVARDAYELASYWPALYGTDAYPWIRVAHVCRDWRITALNTPRFWSYIVLTHKPSGDVLLARSKKAPLSIATSLTSTHVNSGCRLLKQIIAEDSRRLKDLRIIGSSGMICDFCARIKEPADILETLLLSQDVSYGALDQWYSQPSTLPHTLFQGQHPRLRYLEIHQLSVHWGNPLFCTTLVRLIVKGANPATKGTLEQLLSAIEKMVALQELELDDVIPHSPVDSTSSPSPSRTVILPHLRSITLGGADRDCANLLNRLSVSSDTLYDIAGHSSSESSARYLIDTIKGHLAPSKPLRAVNLSQEFNMLHLRGYRTNVDPSNIRERTCVELRMRELVHCPPISSYLVRDANLFANVRTLAIGCGDIDRWEWKDVFAGVPNLCVLSIRGHPQRTFLKALSATHQGEVGRPPSVHVPQLHVLKLSFIRLCTLYHNNPVEFIDEFIDSLVRRRHHGRPIQELHLTHCLNADADDVNRLFAIVPDVHWDGQELKEREWDGGSGEDYDSEYLCEDYFGEDLYEYL